MGILIFLAIIGIVIVVWQKKQEVRRRKRFYWDQGLGASHLFVFIDSLWFLSLIFLELLLGRIYSKFMYIR